MVIEESADKLKGGIQRLGTILDMAFKLSRSPRPPPLRIAAIANLSGRKLIFGQKHVNNGSKRRIKTIKNGNSVNFP